MSQAKYSHNICKTSIPSFLEIFQTNLFGIDSSIRKVQMTGLQCNWLLVIRGDDERNDGELL